jgi:hypothetical protein
LALDGRLGAVQEKDGLSKRLAPFSRVGWHLSPLLHAASKAMRQVFYEGFALFVAAYRTAADKLKRGDPNPGFPLGCFPPALPFVGG